MKKRTRKKKPKMKTKSFKEYLEKRLNKKEIEEIEKQAALEVKILKSKIFLSKNKKRHAN